jgi:hypothetical protein
LFSLSKILDNPTVNITKQDKTVAIHFGTQKVVFDKNINVGKGRLVGVDIVPISSTSNIAMISFMDLHNRLGHPHETVVRATAKAIKIPLQGQATYESCALAKIKKIKLSKKTYNHATTLGGRISFDISSVNVVSHGNNKFWLLVIDEFSSYCWSYFLKYKSDLPEAMYTFVLEFEAAINSKIKIFRSDNAGENIAFKNYMIQNIRHAI